MSFPVVAGVFGVILTKCHFISFHLIMSEREIPIIERVALTVRFEMMSSFWPLLWRDHTVIETSGDHIENVI